MISLQTRALLRLRFAVAFLGEREQAGWWRSSFLSPNARAFLEPVFGNGYKLALGHLEKFFSPSRCESDSLIAMGHGRMERASHGADGLFRY
jgi:hypothetical protein